MPPLLWSSIAPPITQFKGVRKKDNLHKNSSFSASISDGSLRIGLGTYSDELEAARVYDAAA
jgi:hypothetical protein